MPCARRSARSREPGVADGRERAWVELARRFAVGRDRKVRRRELALLRAIDRARSGLAR